ncbi:hypothetical protein E2562_019649 [Oryza meyeriana var. granulata]|uniref:Uncharacterized protein n=1 Tax=Oryza meyeriana var. granulata TaxID=110450 RepID=A0A6G1C7Q5_9ORYZ|nr:hypothetical protein E2562_019649 [Oryza meyeriana var. granulata]
MEGAEASREDQCEAEVNAGCAVTVRRLERAVVVDSHSAQWSGIQGMTEGDAMNAVPMEVVAVWSRVPAGARQSDGGAAGVRWSQQRRRRGRSKAAAYSSWMERAEEADEGLEEADGRDGGG